MAQSVSGGGVQGKDLSKADVSVNIYAFLKAQKQARKLSYFALLAIVKLMENLMPKLSKSIANISIRWEDLRNLLSGDCSNK